MKLEQRVATEFRKGAEEGKGTRSRLREIWGFRRDPLREEPPIREVLSDREEAVLRLARAVGRSTSGEPELLACVGALGLGVSSVLRVVHESLGSAGATQGVLLQGNRFTEEVPVDEGEEDAPPLSYFDVALRQTDFSKVSYLIIDDADEIATYLSGYLERIRQKSGAFRSPVTIVVGLHVMGWLSLTTEIRQSFSEQVWLTPLSLEDMVRVVSNRVRWAKGRSDLLPFTEASLLRIANLSMGLPWAAVALFRALVRESASRGLDSIPDPLIEDVARSQGILAVQALLALTETPDTIRSKVLLALAKSPYGTTSTVLAGLLGVHRTTVNYHLGVLEGTDALAKERRGREVYYIPTEAGRRAIELVLMRGIAPEVHLWKTVAA